MTHWEKERTFHFHWAGSALRSFQDESVAPGVSEARRPRQAEQKKQSGPKQKTKNKTTLAAETERAEQNIAASAAPPNPIRGSVQTDPRTSSFLAIYWR